MPSVCRATRGGVVIVGTLLIATSAVAGTFDTRGRFVLDDVAFTASVAARRALRAGERRGMAAVQNNLGDRFNVSVVDDQVANARARLDHHRR